MSAPENQRRMTLVGAWMGTQFGTAPFFVGVQPHDGTPLSISNLPVSEQIQMLRGILRSLFSGAAQPFVDGTPVPFAEGAAGQLFTLDGTPIERIRVSNETPHALVCTLDVVREGPSPVMIIRIREG
ncbi:MAG TPA: hypothetical protein VJN18_11170 [Polyangiaceae bacterium]|nr:hypothetical protein [Polyangiaceae bacterium]